MSIWTHLFPHAKRWCVVLSLVSATSWSFMDLLVGLNRQVVDGATFTAVTGMSICLLSSVALFNFKNERKRLTWREYMPVLIGSSCQPGFEACYSYALTMAPVGDVVLLYNMNVVWTSLIESALRKSWRLKVQIPSLFLCLIGMTLVTKPSFIFTSQSPLFLQSPLTTSLLSNPPPHHHQLALLSSSSPPTSKLTGKTTTTTATTTQLYRQLTTAASTTITSTTSNYTSITTSMRTPSRRTLAASKQTQQRATRIFLGYSLALAASLFYSVLSLLMGSHPDIHWSSWMMQLGLAHFFFGIILITSTVYAGGYVYLVSGIGGGGEGGVAPLQCWVPIASLFIIGVFNMVGETASLLAIQASSASLTALVATIQIPLAYIWSAIWLSEDVDLWKLAGIGFILLAMVVVIIADCEEEKEEEEEMASLISERNNSKDDDEPP